MARQAAPTWGPPPRGALGPPHTTAAAHRKVRPQAPRPPGPAVALWHGPDQRRHVEHPVVVREVVRRDEIDAGILLQPPVTGAQLGARLQKVRERDLAAPVALGGAFQLTRRPEVGEAEIVGDGHRVWNLALQTSQVTRRREGAD